MNDKDNVIILEWKIRRIASSLQQYFNIRNNDELLESLSVSATQWKNFYVTRLFKNIDRTTPLKSCSIHRRQEWSDRYNFNMSSLFAAAAVSADGDLLLVAAVKRYLPANMRPLLSILVHISHIPCTCIVVADTIFKEESLDNFGGTMERIFSRLLFKSSFKRNINL